MPDMLGGALPVGMNKEREFFFSEGAPGEGRRGGERGSVIGLKICAIRYRKRGVVCCGTGERERFD